MKKISVLILNLCILLVFVLIPALPVHAAGKFSTTITREYWVQSDLSVKARESEEIVNNTSNLYIPSGSDKEFDILSIETGNPENKTILQKSLSTAKLTYNNGTSLNYSSKVENDSATLTAKFPSSLEPGESISFVFEYTHYGMAEQNGAVRDIFLNAFAKESIFSDSRNTTTYNSYIYIPKDFPEENFFVPSGGEKSVSGNYNRYSFTQAQLLEQYVWIQLGRKQYYKFNITQKVKASEVLNTGNQNRYEIVIPRSIGEAQVAQTIYYTKISPEPEWIKKDDQGNLLASFKLKSNFNGEIILEGYTEIVKPKENDLGLKAGAFGNLSQVDAVNMKEYLQSAEFWEVDDPSIQKQANALKGKETDIYTLVEKTYDFVVGEIDYSEVKRFGLNERQGAVKTLQGGSAVCMEYSDLFLTLMRAQGVPARAAFGYGYDPKLKANGQEGHQWVEVYAPALDKWVSVDVTWGENGPALIGGDMNHLYTHVAAASPDDPPGISSVGFGELDLDVASYDIQVLDAIPVSEKNNLLNTEDLLKKYPYTGENLGDNLFDMAQSKLEATYNNVTTGQQLSSDQIFILVALGTILFGGLVVILGLLRKVLRKSDATDNT